MSLIQGLYHEPQGLFSSKGMDRLQTFAMLLTHLTQMRKVSLKNGGSIMGGSNQIFWAVCVR